MATEKWADLKKLTEDELITKHDKLARSGGVGFGHYADELRHREMMGVLNDIRKSLHSMDLSNSIIMKRYVQVSGSEKS